MAALPFAKNAVEDFLTTHTVVPMTLVSDGLSCFTVAKGLGVSHHREISGGGKASGSNVKFRAVNTLLGGVTTTLCGTYHAVNFAKYAYWHLAELQFRFNRRYYLRCILGGLIAAMVASSARPEPGIRLLSFIANRVRCSATVTRIHPEQVGVTALTPIDRTWGA